MNERRCLGVIGYNIANGDISGFWAKAVIFAIGGQTFLHAALFCSCHVAPRDIVARAIQTEIDQGRGFNKEYVHLELMHLGAKKIKEPIPVS